MSVWHVWRTRIAGEMMHNPRGDALLTIDVFVVLIRTVEQHIVRSEQTAMLSVSSVEQMSTVRLFWRDLFVLSHFAVLAHHPNHQNVHVHLHSPTQMTHVPKGLRHVQMRVCGPYAVKKRAPKFVARRSTALVVCVSLVLLIPPNVVVMVVLRFETTFSTVVVVITLAKKANDVSRVYVCVLVDNVDVMESVSIYMQTVFTVVLVGRLVRVVNIAPQVCVLPPAQRAQRPNVMVVV